MSDEYGTWYNIGNSLNVGFDEIVSNINKTLDNFYFDAFSGYFVFAIFLIGIVLMIVNREKRLILFFTTLFTIFIVYIFKSGHFFYQHNYYIIPFVPVMAVLAGYSVSFIKRKWIFVTILIIAAGEGIANQNHDFFNPKTELYKMSLENIMDDISSKDDLISINGNGNPQLIYLSHRKGWNCSNEDLNNKEYISDIIAKGCKFIVIDQHKAGKISLPYEVAFVNEDFLIYDMETG